MGAASVLLTLACGDALGVPYEGLPAPERVKWGEPTNRARPGTWSDDTSMSVCVALAASKTWRTPDELIDRVGENFTRWVLKDGRGIGRQTRTVVNAAHGVGGGTEKLYSAAQWYAENTEQHSGNGALMRAGIVGCVSDDPNMVAHLSEAICRLTHYDEDCVASTILWAEAVRVARLTGAITVRDGLDLLPDHSRATWSTYLDEAEANPSHVFAPDNRWTIGALQQSWAVALSASSVVDGLRRAVADGHDTDTVAAIVGALLGAVETPARLPAAWLNEVHGWPGMNGVRLAGLGDRVDAVRREREGHRPVRGLGVWWQRMQSPARSTAGRAGRMVRRGRGGSQPVLPF